MDVINLDIWNKNDLVERFTAVCEMLTDDLTQGSFIDQVSDDMTAIATEYDQANIPNIDRWWRMDHHADRWWAEQDDLEAKSPGSLKRNIKAGVNLLRKHPHLLAEFKSLHRVSAESALKYIPHIVQYSPSLNDNGSFVRLSDMVSSHDIVAIPSMMIGTHTSNLKQAFALNVELVSADQTPIKPKLMALGL